MNVRHPWQHARSFAAWHPATERVRRDTVPRRTSGAQTRGYIRHVRLNGRTPLSRWASDRDHYERKPLAWYAGSVAA